MTIKLSRTMSMISVVVITSAVAFVSMSCGEDEKKDAPAAPTTTVKYADVSAFINANCANSGCHTGANPAGSYNMSTRLGTASKAAASVARIEAGTMPPTGAQKTAFDADDATSAKLLEWLKAGATE